MEFFSVRWDTRVRSLIKKASDKANERLTFWKEDKAGLGGKVVLEFGPVTSPDRPSTTRRQRKVHVIWKRFIKKDLSFISLEKMHKKAKSFGLPIDKLSELDNHKLDYKITQTLRKLYDEASAGNKESLLLLEKEYVHHSHQPVSRGSLNPDKEESDPDKVATNGQREIFYNKPDEADY